MPRVNLQERTGDVPFSDFKPEDVEVTVLKFAYETLSEVVAAQAMAAAQEIKRRDRNASLEMVAIGHKLSEMKALLRRRFTDWVETEFNYGTTMARQMMAVAERFGEKTTLSVALSPTTMRLLASTQFADEEVEEITERAEGEGRKVTVKEVTAALAQKKATAAAPALTYKDLRIEIGNYQAASVVGVLAAAGGPEQVAGEALGPVVVDMRKETGAVFAPTRVRVWLELDAEYRDRLVDALAAGLLGDAFNAEEERLLTQQLTTELGGA